MAPDYFAHSLPRKPKGKWQRLEDHLKNVAETGKALVQMLEAGATHRLVM
jgi:hypothetical protein